MTLRRLMSLVRKAIDDYNLIEENDKIAVGISGGKDSLTLLYALAGIRRFYPRHFELTAVCVDLGFEGFDLSPVEQLCRELDVPFHVVHSDIGRIIFEDRKEKNPCSLCAKMRKGALNTAMKELGCNKLALGHHKDDAVETFIMNLFQEGRVGCFQPVTYLSRKDLTMIRPMVMAEESMISAAVHHENLPVVKSKCPADGNTNREKTKEWIRMMDKESKGFKKRLYGALERGHISGF